MKTVKNICAALMASFAIASCATPVNIEKDDSVNFANYKTYMWVDTRYNENDNTTRPISYGDISVRIPQHADLTRFTHNLTPVLITIPV